MLREQRRVDWIALQSSQPGVALEANFPGQSITVLGASRRGIRPATIEINNLNVVLGILPHQRSCMDLRFIGSFKSTTDTAIHSQFVRHWSLSPYIPKPLITSA